MGIYIPIYTILLSESCRTLNACQIKFHVYWTSIIEALIIIY